MILTFVVGPGRRVAAAAQASARDPNNDNDGVMMVFERANDITALIIDILPPGRTRTLRTLTIRHNQLSGCRSSHVLSRNLLETVLSSARIVGDRINATVTGSTFEGE